MVPPATGSQVRDDRAVSSTTSLAILLAITAVLALALALFIFVGSG